MATLMASPVSIPSLHSLSSSAKPKPQTLIFSFCKWNSQLGLTPFSSWSGLRHVGTSISHQISGKERKREIRGCKGVYASLFGVGAPEALVIGVVALLVFGPKGLAEVARNLGKTLRAFQPTIKELQEVSREFKSTLEQEIGLDEIKNSMQNPNITRTISTPPVSTPKDPDMVADPNGAPPPTKAYSSEEYLKITEEQLKASTAKEQKQETPLEPQTQPQEAEAAGAVNLPQDLKKPESEQSL